MKMKLKKGDKVRVLLGKDRGKEGKVDQVLPKKGAVLVTGVNKVKKHVKPAGEGKPGGIVELVKPLAAFKVGLVCPNCNQVTRIGITLDKSSGKYRVCKKCQQTIK